MNFQIIVLADLAGAHARTYTTWAFNAMGGWDNVGGISSGPSAQFSWAGVGSETMTEQTQMNCPYRNQQI
jgi:hypothetical protein